VAKPAALIRRLDQQLSVLGSDDDRSAGAIRHQNSGATEARLAMAPIEGDGFFDGGARFEHLLARISPDIRQTGIGLPHIVESRHPVPSQTFGVHAALRSIVKADIHRSKMFFEGGNEPHPRPGVRPILVVGEQSPVRIGQHEDGAGRRLNRAAYQQAHYECYRKWTAWWFHIVAPSGAESM